MQVQARRDELRRHHELIPGPALKRRDDELALPESRANFSPDTFEVCTFVRTSECWLSPVSEPYAPQALAAARREGQAEAWDEAEAAAWEAHKQDHHEPWGYMPDNPYRNGADQ